MKKLFLPLLLAAAAFVGCSQKDMTEIPPQIQMGTTDLGVGTNQGDDESRASYDEDLRFFWEEGDEIAILQDCLGGYQQSLALFNGADSNAGFFRNTNYEYVIGSAANFHFVYPASSAKLSSKSITLPAQDGVWTPVLVASTDKTTVDALHSVKLTSIAGALAVRVFGNDKQTPYRVKSITVSGTKPFLGGFVGSLDGDGKMVYEPNGTESSFTADVEHIELNAANNYEYRFEVLPVNAGVVTITLTDVEGNVISLSTSSEKTFKVNTRTVVNVAWNPSISVGEVTSMYEEFVATGESAIAPSTIYVKGVKSNGGIGAPQILLNGSVYPHSVLSDGTYVLEGVPSGEHTVSATVKQPDGSLKSSEPKTVRVTVIPTINFRARSTYAYNDGTLVKENVVANNKSIFYEGVTITNSDDYTTSVLDLSKVTFVYGSTSVAASASASSSNPQTISNSIAVGAYQCYVQVPLRDNANYKVASAASTIYVTGVPYSVSCANISSISGWTNNSTNKTGNCLLIKDGGSVTSPTLFYASSSCSYDIALSAFVYCYRSSHTSATFRLTMEMTPSSGATFTEDLSGGILLDNTGGYRFTEKVLNTTLKQSSGVKISTKKVSSKGLSIITSPGMNFDVISVNYR